MVHVHNEDYFLRQALSFFSVCVCVCFYKRYIHFHAGRCANGSYFSGVLI